MYTDPSGEIWHVVIGAVVGGVINLAANWDNIDNFWEGAAAFGVGAGAGALTAATGGAGASFWTVAGVSSLGGAATMGTNNIIGQTGNGVGLGDVEWGSVVESSLVGAVSGFAAGGVGHWAANSSALVNGLNSPLLRSAAVSPLAAGAGHIAGGTTSGLFKGRSINQAFHDSFNGLDKSMAMGLGIGVASTVGMSYANGINPVTGRVLAFKTEVQSLGAGRTEVKKWLQNVGNIERGQLTQDILGAGFKRMSPSNSPVEVFELGGMRIRLDPPQLPKTPYNHMHLEYGRNSYNIFLNSVNYKSPAAHIPIR